MICQSRIGLIFPPGSLWHQVVAKAWGRSRTISLTAFHTLDIWTTALCRTKPICKIPNGNKFSLTVHNVYSQYDAQSNNCRNENNFTQLWKCANVHNFRNQDCCCSAAVSPTVRLTLRSRVAADLDIFPIAAVFLQGVNVSTFRRWTNGFLSLSSSSSIATCPSSCPLLEDGWNLGSIYWAALLGQFPPFFPFAIMPPLLFTSKMPSLESLASFQYFWFWHVAKLLSLVTYNVSVISRKIWRSCSLDHLSSTAHMKQNDKTGKSGFSR